MATTKKLFYIRSKTTGQYYIGSSYSYAKFSNHKPVSTFMKWHSAEQIIKSRIVGHRYSDEDVKPWRENKGSALTRDSVEIREATLTLE